MRTCEKAGRGGGDAKRAAARQRTLEKEPPTVKMLQRTMPTNTIFFRDMRSAGWHAVRNGRRSGLQWVEMGRHGSGEGVLQRGDVRIPPSAGGSTRRRTGVAKDGAAQHVRHDKGAGEESCGARGGRSQCQQSRAQHRRLHCVHPGPTAQPTALLVAERVGKAGGVSLLQQRQHACGCETRAV